MTKKNIDEKKASYGVDAEVADATGKTATKLPGSKDNSEMEAIPQGSSEKATFSEVPAPKKKGKATKIKEMLDRLSEMDADEVDAVHAAMSVSEDAEDKTEDEPTQKLTDVAGITKADIDVSEDVKALFNGADLTEDFKSKAADIFATVVVTRVNEKLAEITEAAEAELAEKVAAIETNLGEKIDTYLDYVVEQFMTENKLGVEAGLRAELAGEFMNGLKRLFDEHYIDVPDEKVDVVEALTAKTGELEDELSEAVEAVAELRKELGARDKKDAVTESVAGLTDVQAGKISKLAENIEYTDAETFCTKLAEIREGYFGDGKKTAAAAKALAESIDGEVDADQKDEVVLDPNMARYADAISRTNKK